MDNKTTFFTYLIQNQNTLRKEFKRNKDTYKLEKNRREKQKKKDLDIAKITE